jgi:hypothetical protein
VPYGDFFKYTVPCVDGACGDGGAETLWRYAGQSASRYHDLDGVSQEPEASHQQQSSHCDKSLLHERTSKKMADGEGKREAERIGGLASEQRLVGGLAAERATKRHGTVEQLPWLSEAVKKRILSLALGEKVS